MAPLLIAMYIAGFIGLQVDSVRPLFLYLVPYNLIASALILLRFHTDWNRAFILFCLFTFLVGYWIEVLGVKTGLIFGYYHYGEVLGVKMLDVPLLIGVNWLMLIYSIGAITNQLRQPIWVKLLVGALMMVTLDFFIEPVAITLDFWQWETALIPIQNYIAWFVVSVMLLGVYYSLQFGKENRMAGLFFMVQLGFFALHTIAYVM